MKKNSKRKAMVLIAVLIIVVLVSIQGVIFLIRNRNARSQEVSEIGNNKKEEMLADEFVDASENPKINPPSEEKQKIMENLSKNWDEGRVKKEKIKISAENEMEVVVPVPIGYTASKVEGENTLDGGLVIYEGDDEINSDNVQEAKKSKNQWVWVPVYDPEDMYGVDSDGKMWGKLYNFNESGRSNDNWTEGEDGKINITDFNKETEADVLDISDNDQSLTASLSETEKEELFKELNINFEKTIESIKKYGGFYIGRYETGGLNGIAKVVKDNGEISNQTWSIMYRKCKTLKGKNNNVVTGMLYGCEWDRALQWLVDTSKVESKYGILNDNSWGLYGSEKNNTGKYERCQKNNIYDMLGNVGEWTIEGSGGMYRHVRGREPRNYGYVNAYERYKKYVSTVDNNLGCRASLYINL